MHPELASFPLGDRHLRVSRQDKIGRYRERGRERESLMMSPDTSVEMGSTGSMEIVFVPFSRKVHSICRGSSFELAFRDSALPTHLHHKRVYSTLNLLSHQEYGQ